MNLSDGTRTEPLKSGRLCNITIAREGDTLTIEFLDDDDSAATLVYDTKHRRGSFNPVASHLF